MADEKRMRSGPSPTRSRTRGQRTATGPMPVTISRSGRCPWRTNRWRPSSVRLSEWQLSKAATSASTACAKSARAPLRKTSVSGSAKVPGWESWKTLVSVTAYHSFGGEVEASNTPTIRRLIPSRRHQISSIAREENRIAAIRHAHNARVHGRDDATALALAGFVIGLLEHDHATAADAFEAALSLSPSSAFSYRLGSVIAGRTESDGVMLKGGHP